MSKQLSQAVAYAQNFLSFLMMNNVSINLINQIYLFGSGARGQLEERSDIDLFIDTKESAKIEMLVKESLSRFYHSKDYEKWKLFRFTYPLSVQVGALNEWELQKSIEAEGILLYSKHSMIGGRERKILLVLTWPKDKKKYLKISRLLLGRKELGYKEKSLIKELNGEKISTNIFILPKENLEAVEKILKKEKADYFFREMFFF